MAKKKGSTLQEYAIYELAFLERKLEEMQGYVDKADYSKLVDRFNPHNNATVASIEAQRKDIRDTIIAIAQLTEIIARMRRDEDPTEKNPSLRGDPKLSALDKGLLDE